MESMLDSLMNPYALIAVLVLSMVSTFFTIVGIRQKNLPYIFYGVGSGIPTFNVANWKMWVAGGFICLIGWQVSSKMSSPL